MRTAFVILSLVATTAVAQLPLICPKVEYSAPADRGSACPAGSVYDSGQCWTCTAGRPYISATPAAVEIRGAMLPGEAPGIRGTRRLMACKLVTDIDTAATFVSSTGCQSGTFYDPRNGGECWSCPGGYGRSAEAVTSDRACQVVIIVGPFSRATFHKKVGSCASGTFWDPRNGGECWSCPSGFDRTASSVTAGDACSRYWNGTKVQGTIRQMVSMSGPSSTDYDAAIGAALQCPAGQTEDAGRCLSCAAGTTIEHATTLTPRTLASSVYNCVKTVQPPAFNAAAFTNTADRTTYCQQAKGCNLVSYPDVNACLSALWADEKSRLALEAETARIHSEASRTCSGAWIVAQCIADELDKLWAASAFSATRPASSWAKYFDGKTIMSPYAWQDGAAAIAAGLKGAVAGGDVNGTPLMLCRASYQNGLHPGKLYGNACHIGWGGKEVVLTSGFQVLTLVMSPANLPFFPTDNWRPPSQVPAARTFSAGYEGDTSLRVCRARQSNGWHPGKEYGGKCNIGFGGEEVVASDYQVLLLYNTGAGGNRDGT
jgi:hypothetical protein